MRHECDKLCYYATARCVRMSSALLETDTQGVFKDACRAEKSCAKIQIINSKYLYTCCVFCNHILAPPLIISRANLRTVQSFRTRGKFRRTVTAYVLDHFRSFRIWPIVYDIILIGLRSVSVRHTALKPCISHAHPNSIIC